ncbi:hypothetical protein [Paenibacillus medicaginis]|uniref:Phage tail protein n=1 Tax=Paenibacillus medicaginis TaxID=1470560 RepID=A0ABV5BV22_9BACL
MATRQLKVLTEVGTHGVGSLNVIQVKTLSGGAKVIGTDVDNYTLVEDAGFNADGDRTVKQLSAITNKAYLIASPEIRNMGEALVDFYNGVGEFARIVIPEPGYTRFETSSYSLNTGVSEVAKGHVAHFDPATKKFIISVAGTPHTDYAGSSAQFLVVASEDETGYTLGAPTVRLEVSKA